MGMGTRKLLFATMIGFFIFIIIKISCGSQSGKPSDSVIHESDITLQTTEEYDEEIVQIAAVYRAVYDINNNAVQTDAPEHTAFRVVPLDEDRFYPMVYQKPVPYPADDNLNIGAVYHIPENEFEGVVKNVLDIDSRTLQSKTDYCPEDGTYRYRPRGFYELEGTEFPYPEVVDYTENPDGTITLTVNAVFPYENTSKAFAHEVVVCPLEDGGFYYVSNKIVEGKCDAWRRCERLNDNEWEEIYGAYDINAGENVKEGMPGDMNQNGPQADEALWYLPQADECLLIKKGCTGGSRTGQGSVSGCGN